MRMFNQFSKLKIFFFVIIFLSACFTKTVYAEEKDVPDSLEMHVKKGDIITFGSFSPLKKDRVFPNKRVLKGEDIEWKVLTVKDGKALCISRYAVGTRVWKVESDPLDDHCHTWDTCSLRKWLNGRFYKYAFSSEEKRYILKTEIPADYNEVYDEKAGESTRDYVFLLSSEEVREYLPADQDRKLSLPPHARFPGSFSNLKKQRVGAWFLRTPGVYMNSASLVLSDGFVDDFGSYNQSEYDVRPAIWLNVGKSSPNTPKTAPPKEETPKKYKVGDILSLGKYPKDKAGKKKEDIEWLIIKREGDKALVISRYVLDRVPYYAPDHGNPQLTWETSYIRSWLNEIFYEKVFNDSEKKWILKSKVIVQSNPYWPGIKQGKNTSDYLFLLSAAEAKSYIREPKDRGARPTEYALTKDVVTSPKYDGNAWWWLRTAGALDEDDEDGPDRYMLYVDSDSTVDRYGEHGENSNIYMAAGVRPSMWVDVSSGDIPITGNVDKERERKPATKLTTEKLNDMKTGDIVTFGTYEQDNDKNSGPEKIRWIVMVDRGAGKYILLSEDIIDYQCYHPFQMDVCENITWHDAAIRKWLNEGFLNKAFSEEDRKFMVNMQVNSNCSDRVSLLSGSEVDILWQDPELERYVFPRVSEYVRSNPEVYMEPYHGSTEWLCRTRNADDTSISYMDYNGYYERYGGCFGPYYNGVRPIIMVAVPKDVKK